MQTLSAHNNFLFSSYLDLFREKYVILGDRMDFADILQSMKTGKKCENPDIPGSIGLPQNVLARL